MLAHTFDLSMARLTASSLVAVLLQLQTASIAASGSLHTFDLSMAGLTASSLVAVMLQLQTASIAASGSLHFTEDSTLGAGHTAKGFGVALFDLDGDNDIDLYLNNNNKQNKLYEQNGGGNWVDRTGGTAGASTGTGTGVAVGDLDGDGDPEIWVANFFSPNILYRNDGNLQFSDVTAASGSYEAELNCEDSGRTEDRIDCGQQSEPDCINSGCCWSPLVEGSSEPWCFRRVFGYSMGVSLGDLDGDGYLDAFVTNSGINGQSNMVLRNKGGLEFEDVSGGSGLSGARRGRCAVIADLDEDGDLDVYVVNGADQSNILYRNEGGFVFTDVTGTSGLGDVEPGSCAAIADYDGDSRLDIFLAKNNHHNIVYKNLGGLVFEVAFSGFGEDAQGVVAADFDHDGRLDVAVANNGQQNLLLRNNGNFAFENVASAAGFADTGESKSLAVADIDGDGDVDVYLTDQDISTPNRLYYNTHVAADSEDWLVVKLLDYAGRKMLHCAEVRLLISGSSTVVGQRTVGIVNGYGSVGGYSTHFGLGAGDLSGLTFDLQVRPAGWTDFLDFEGNAPGQVHVFSVICPATAVCPELHTPSPTSTSPSTSPTQSPSISATMNPTTAPTNSKSPTSSPTTVCANDLSQVPLGSYCDVAQDVIVPCPVGKWSSQQELSTPTGCQDCPAGKRSGVLGIDSVEDCQPCAGIAYYCPAGSSEAIEVANGYYSTPEGAAENARTGQTKCGESSDEFCRGGRRSYFPPGYYEDQDGKRKLCPPGFYCNGGAKTECESGRYCDEGSSAQRLCPAGFYCPSATERVQCSEPGEYCPTGSTSPGECPAGQEGVSEEGFSTCISCTPGKFRAATSTELRCSPCTASTYAPDFGMPACTQCEGGTVTSSSGSAFCTYCPAGKRSNVAATSCEDCPNDTYSLGGVTQCAACEGGSFSTEGSATCSTCPPGFTTNTVEKRCDKCSPGQHSPDGMQCLACDGEGEFSAESGSSYCSIARAGYFPNTQRTNEAKCGEDTFSIGGVDRCTDCAIGSFSSAGSAACTSCAPGTSTNRVAKSCVDCLPGFFSPDGGECRPCDGQGEYSESTRATFCSIVAAGMRPTLSRTSQEPCPTNTFSLGASDECTPCAAGSLSEPGSSACSPCEPGEELNSAGNACTPCTAGKARAFGDEACAPCSAGEFSFEGAGSCSKCLPGTRANEASSGATGCDACENGSFQDEAGQTACKVCDELAGSINIEGSLACRPCPAGSVASGEQCIECAAGFFSPVGSSTCTTCDQGRFSSAGSSSCSACPKGKYGGSSPKDSGDHCVDCGQGKFGNAEAATSSNACNECPGGSVSGAAGATECATKCLAGERSDETGTTCVICGRGSVSEAESASCTVCEAGTYASDGKTLCKPCEAGYACSGGEKQRCEAGTTSQASAFYCEQCEAGRYENGARTECIMCAEGEFSPNTKATGSAACKPCEKGTYGTASRRTCAQCPGGRWSDDEGATSQDTCVKCGEGKFSAARGGFSETICNDCPDGIVSTQVGATSCNENNACAAGQRSSDDGTTCEPCPPGEVSNEGEASCSLCPSGEYANNNRTECLSCEAGSYCVAGLKALCSVGKYTEAGEADCLSCPPGKHGTPQRTECELCPEGRFNPAPGVATDDGCDECGSGTYSKGDRRACEQCVEGRWSSDIGASGADTCTKCVAGKFAAALGATSEDVCNLCPGGKVSDTEGVTACSTECATGTRSSDDGTQCVPCLAGSTFQDMSKASSCKTCTRCAPGQRIDQQCTASSDTRCVACAAGTFASGINEASCSGCDVGQWSSNAAPSCSLCPIGRYGDQTAGQTSGDEHCAPCPKGSYSSIEGLASANDCSLCLPGTKGIVEGATTKDEGCKGCDVGEYQELPGQIECKKCDGPGEYSELPSAAVFCRIATAGEKPNSARTGVVACPKNTFSVGGSDTCAKCESGSSEEGSAACTPCLPGYRTDLETNLCVACEPGTYSTDGRECLACDGPGQFSASKESVFCSTSAAGTRPNENRTDTVKCPKNTYSDAASETCTPCSSGFSEEGSAVCTPCQPGEEINDDKTACVPCAPGGARAYDEDSCSPCPSGTFAKFEGSAYCDTCPAGTRSIGIACVDCDAGAISPAGASTCEFCDSGKYKDDATNSCEACQAGRYGNSSGLTECIVCKDGDISPAGASECKPCGAGTYKNNDTQSCEACPAGRYGNIAGLSDNMCEGLCPPGSYSFRYATECTPCAAGKFAARSGMESCELCAKEDGFTSGEGAVGCVCDSGRYREHDGSCVLCSDGMQCTEIGTDLGVLSLTEGFWRQDSTSANIIPCPYDDACQGGNASCTNGNEGVLCAVCSKGYFRSAGAFSKCEECHPSQFGAWATLIAGTLLLLLLLGLILTLNRRMPSGLLRPFISAVQNFSILLLFPTSYPSSLKTLFHVIGSMDLGLSLIFPQCLSGIELNFYITLCTLSLVVFFICLGLFLPLAFVKIRNRGSTWREAANLPLGRRAIKDCFVFVLLVYPGLSGKAMEFFRCREIEGTWFLMADYSIECYDSTWHGFLPLALVLLVGIAIGFPLAIFAVLWPDRNNLYDPATMRATDHPLDVVYRPYRPGAWYFESVAMIYKVSLWFTLVYFESGSVVQFLVAVLVNFVMLCVFMKVEPMGSRDAKLLNALQVLISILLTSLALGGFAMEALERDLLLVEVGVTDRATTDAASIILAIQTILEVLAFALIVSVALYAGQRVYRRVSDNERVMNARNSFVGFLKGQSSRTPSQSTADGMISSYEVNAVEMMANPMRDSKLNCSQGSTGPAQ